MIGGDRLKNGAGIAEEFINKMGSAEHIKGEPGDYIGADGRLHCGKCHEGKEFYLKPFDRYVPSLCRCGRIERDDFERRQRENQDLTMVQELSTYNLMDEKLLKATFENAEMREESADAYTMAKNYVKRFDEICASKDDMKGLLIYGPTGTGKSYLAACIANALMKNRVPVLFTSVIRMTSADPDTVREVIGQTRRARLLVLDDLGAERGTDFKLEQVFNIIETRSNSRKPLIVTTNYSENDMRGENDVRYKRIWERVRAMCYPVRMESVSWRKDITAEALERFRKLTT